MSDQKKKILVLAAFIASVFAIGAALYFTFFRPAPPAPTVQPTPEEEAAAGALPISETSTEGGKTPTTAGTGALPPADEVARGGRTQVTAITTSPVMNVELNADGQRAQFYNERDGRFYAIDADGNVQSLTEKTFTKVEKVNWNKDASKAFLGLPDGSNIVYNFEN